MKSSIHLSNKHLENIGRMFKKLYNDEQLTDVTLYCKDGTIKAHKLILATSSPYFHRIFTENNREHPLIIMHGVSYHHMQLLIELIYKGSVEVGPEVVNVLYELAGEFQLAGLSGILRNEEEDKCCDSSPDRAKSVDGNLHNRDTRFKGMKRVAVDYKDLENEAKVRKTNDFHVRDSEDGSPIRRPCEPNSNIPVDLQPEFEVNDADGVDEEPFCHYTVNNETVKLSAWAKKQRKFKCDLCPSSFKRSSHLTRHQLVHTGERPYACDQCDKAFSRHDKLKHHIRKTHGQDFESEYLELSNCAAPSSPPLYVLSHLKSEPPQEPLNEDNSTVSTPKRPRGRPRKYPIVEKSLIKRGRGRRKLNPVRSVLNGENYDITNLPYGDLEYLTMPLHQQCDEGVLIEPLVEIKTADKEYNETEKEDDKGDSPKETSEKVEDNSSHNNKEEGEEASQPSPATLKVLENKIAKIGECTISVANHQIGA